MMAIPGESATVSGDGVASTSGTSDVSQYPVHSLAIEGCVYRGEGNANLVVAVPSVSTSPTPPTPALHATD